MADSLPWAHAHPVNHVMTHEFVGSGCHAVTRMLKRLHVRHDGTQVPSAVLDGSEAWLFADSSPTSRQTLRPSIMANVVRVEAALAVRTVIAAQCEGGPRRTGREIVC